MNVCSYFRIFMIIARYSDESWVYFEVKSCLVTLLFSGKKSNQTILFCFVVILSHYIKNFLHFQNHLIKVTASNLFSETSLSKQDAHERMPSAIVNKMSSKP